MKHFACSLLSLMFCIAVLADDEGFRIFSDQNGRTFKGQLKEYNAASETVVLRRSDGKTGSIQLALFSDEDRVFIIDWGASRRFLEGLDIVPSLKTIAVSKKESGISGFTKRVFDSSYEVRFINGTDAPFGRIEFEYCIFYNQGERKHRTVQYEEGVCYGKGVVEGLDPSIEHVSITKPIRLFTEGGQVGIFGTETVSLANMRGIWLRLKTTLPSGSEIEREYRTADDPMWEWAPYSFGAGLNEGPKKQTFYYIE
jgi:hypothetical protein